MRNVYDEKYIFLVIGHAGSGKTTLVNFFKKNIFHKNILFFHADKYIDWKWVVDEVDKKNKGEDEYVPFANSFALNTMFKNFPNFSIYIYDGNGLPIDYFKILEPFGFNKKTFILLY